MLCGSEFSQKKSLNDQDLCTWCVTVISIEGIFKIIVLEFLGLPLVKADILLTSCLLLYRTEIGIVHNIVLFFKFVENEIYLEFRKIQ
jgi:hypothetical protein